jgi:hypothetical protein
VHKVKSHKSVEQIAKKHRLEVSFVKNQLEMGIPIEHEHTKDKDLATDIALQHLDEIPDYYTRLKKMEADAKKHHKKFKDVKEATDGIGASSPKYSLHRWFNDGGWVQAGGKYDGKPCAKQPGQTTKPFCRDPDDRANMSKQERSRRSAKKRREDPNPNRSGAAKIVTKEEFIQEKKGEKDACYHKVKSRYKIWPSAYASGALVKCRKVGASNWGTKSESTNSLDYEWSSPIRDKANRFCPKCGKLEGREECKYGAKYWDMFSLPSELISSKKDFDANMPHPGNFPESYDHEHSMARSEISTIISAAKRLRKKMKGEGNIEAWVQSKITKAADYLDSAADYVDSGEMKEQVKPLEGPYDKFSRYVNAAKATSNPQTKVKILKTASKLYPKNVDESVGSSVKLKPGSGLGGGVQSYPKGQEPIPRKPGEEPQLPQFSGFVKKAKARIKKEMQISHYEPEGDQLDEKCWDGYKKKGMKTMFGKRYPNCVKKEEFSNWRADFGLSEQSAYGPQKGGWKIGQPVSQHLAKKSTSQKIKDAGVKYGKKAFNEDWQSANRKDRTDGMSRETVKKYRDENPGSKLQTAVTEKNPKGKRAKRRANFCRRMKGMKDRLTSEKTAKDPDSKINKALRRWRCN